MAFGPSMCGHPTGDDDEFCTNPPGWGTSHPGVGRCRKHGGSTKNGEKEAQRMMIRQAAKEACKALELQFDTVTPEQALQEELNLSHAMVQWFTSHTDEDSASWPIWHELWMSERRHLTHVVKMMLDAGIAERQVRVMEEQAATIALVIRTILDRLELNEDQLRRAPSIVREVLGSPPKAIEAVVH